MGWQRGVRITLDGWTLPTTKQINDNRGIGDFLPVLGGHYANGSLDLSATHGGSWGAEASTSVKRYGLRYDISSLYTDGSIRRFDGIYIRCVSEEKTVTDLMYMLDF